MLLLVKDKGNWNVNNYIWLILFVQSTILWTDQILPTAHNLVIDNAGTYPELWATHILMLPTTLCIRIGVYLLVCSCHFSWAYVMQGENFDFNQIFSLNSLLLSVACSILNRPDISYHVVPSWLLHWDGQFILHLNKDCP